MTAPLITMYGLAMLSENVFFMNACWMSGEILLTSTDIIIRLYKHFLEAGNICSIVAGFLYLAAELPTL